MNLRDEHGPYKHLIGQVILDKNPNIRTVVNKLATIDEKFRFFHMELLAGVPEYVAQVKESGCTFQLNFATVSILFIHIWLTTYTMPHIPPPPGFISVARFSYIFRTQSLLMIL